MLKSMKIFFYFGLVFMNVDLCGEEFQDIGFNVV